MSYKEDDNLTDGIEENTEIGDISSDISTEASQPIAAPIIDVTEVKNRDIGVRKRIDDLLEQKRLKKLLDDSDDW